MKATEHNINNTEHNAPNILNNQHQNTVIAFHKNKLLIIEDLQKFCKI